MVSVALTCGGLIPAASAQTVTQEVVVSLGGEVANNPYLEEADRGASVGATAEIRPRLSYDTSVTRFDLEGYARGTAFAEDYGFQDDYGAAARVTQRATEQLSLSLNAGISSTDSPSNILSPGVEGGVPGGPLTPGLPLDDVTVLGARGRITTINAGAGIEYTASARDRIGLSGNYQNVSLTHPGAADYEVGSVEAKYDRVVSARATVGLIGGYRTYNYDEALSSDAKSLSVLGSIGLQLDEAWKLTAAAGVARTRLDASAMEAERTLTSFSGNASLCREDTRESLCVDYARQTQPTGYAGIRNSDIVSVSYSFRASEYDSVTLGGTYSRDSNLASGATPVPATELVGVRGGYERRINQRLSSYIEASVDRLRRSDLSIDPRVRVGAGIRYVFGRTG
jgi:hypothetical protein